MHASNCPFCFFIHFKNTEWELQLARPHAWLVPYLTKDTCSTLREFTVEAVSITHIRKDCWHPWCGLVTKWQPWGPHPDLVGRVCGDTGNKLPGGWKHLGVSSDTGKGFVLGPGLHSLRLPGEWQALRVDRGTGVPGGVIQSPLCPSSPFWAHELHHGSQHGLEIRWLFQECSDTARPLGPW